MPVWKISMHAHAYSIHQHMRESFYKKLICYFYVRSYIRQIISCKTFLIHSREEPLQNKCKKKRPILPRWVIDSWYWASNILNNILIFTHFRKGPFLHPVSEVCEPEIAEIMNKNSKTIWKVKAILFYIYKYF